jgi:tRNA pseudouridine38-40 synthase
MTLAYDGTFYHGWQEQPGEVTVQGALVENLAPILRDRPAVEGASRTDSGVHALGQVVAIRTASTIDIRRLHSAINSRLPDDMAVTDMREARPDFRPSSDATGKHYRYRLYRGPFRPIFEGRFVWHWYWPLNIEAMRAAAQLMVGEHDFASFQARGGNREVTVRNLTRVDVVEAGPELHIEVEGDRFLYRMVRNMVGTLTEVGRGHRPPEWVQAVLEARDRRAAGPTAPPEGLCLMEVRYPPEPSSPCESSTSSPA